MASIKKSFEEKPLFWGVSIILLGTLARLWFLSTGQLNLVQDEAQYWDWTRHMQLTYYSKGPMIAWIISLFTSIFGNTEFGVRFGSLVGTFLAQCIAFWGVAKLFKRPVAAVWTVFIMNTMPVFMALGILMTTDNPFILFWLCAVFALYSATIPYEPSLDRANDESRNKPFVLIAIFLGLGILSKYTMLGFIGLSVIFSFIVWYKDKLPIGYWRKLAYALAGGIMLGFLPTLIWNLQNGFVGYKHVLYLIGASGKNSHSLLHFKYVVPFLGEQIGMASPWWLFFMMVGGFAILKSILSKKGNYKFGLTLRQSALISIFFVPTWFFFFLWSFHSKVLGNWAVISYVTGSIIAGFAFESFWNNKRKTRSTWFFISILIFVLLNFQNLLPLPDNLNPTHRLKGWTNLGVQLENIKESQFKDPKSVFYISDEYDMTAALAFYAKGQPRTYCSWIDRRMNQYDMWDGPNKDKIGWDSIYVIKKFKGKADKEIYKMYDRVSSPIHIQTKFKGKPARKFTVYLCYGYNGYWPRDPKLRF